LSIKNNIEKEVADFQRNAGNVRAIDKKLEELTELISNTEINSEKASEFKHRFNNAFNQTKDYSGIEAFQKLDISDNTSREDLLDEFSILLSNSQINSKSAKKYIKGDRISRLVLIIISLTMITLGFGMIIMPAPPFFEMFTIYYFNQNDGITIMDLISLLIVLAGIYFLIKGIVRKPVGN